MSIATWITFKLPSDDSFLEPGANGQIRSSKWKSLIRPWSQAAGHERSFWGTKCEDKEQGVLISAWRDKSAFDDFSSTASYQGVIETLDKGSQATSCTVIDFARLPFYIPLAGYIGVNWALFPVDTVESATKIRPMQSLVAFRPDAPSQMRQSRYSPIRGQIRETQTCNGQEARWVLWLHYWNSAETEASFKGHQSSGVTHGERWENSLRAAGAVKHWEEHYECRPVQSIFHD